ATSPGEGKSPRLDRDSRRQHLRFALSDSRYSGDSGGERLCAQLMEASRTRMSNPPATGKPAPKRSTGITCLLVNQFATPGLGSIMARRYVEGAIQLLLAIIGFVLFIAWFMHMFDEIYRSIAGLPEQPARYPWFGKAGVLIFILSWLLAWPT